MIIELQVNMKSIFRRLTIQNPNLSSLMVFNMTIRQHRSPQATIIRYFDELVDKSDYSRAQRDTVLEHCLSLGI